MCGPLRQQNSCLRYTHSRVCTKNDEKSNQKILSLVFEYYNSTWADNCLRAWARAPRRHPTHVWGTHIQKCVPKLMENQGKNFLFSVWVLHVAHRLASVLACRCAAPCITKFMSEVHIFKIVYQNWCNWWILMAWKVQTTLNSFKCNVCYLIILFNN